MTNEELHAALIEPFDIGELKFFPVTLTEDKKKGKVGSYIDARAVMDRLDGVVGPDGWSTTYRCIDPADKAVECTLSIRFGGDWVARADVGYPNDAKDADNPAKEAWKAAYSDSLKRAAVQFGIGRYIYSLELEKDWLPVDQYRKFTEQPRIKAHGATQQASGAEQSRRKMGLDPLPAAKPSFTDYTREMGYHDDTVIATSQRLFGNREPAQLTKAEKARLLVALEDEKRKEAVGA